MSNNIDVLNKSILDLSDIINFVFNKQEYFEFCSIDKFPSFLKEITYHYNKRKNPFHNFKHGVMVMHGCFLYS